MRPFLHHRRAAIDAAIRHANEVLRKYRDLDLDLSDALERFINEAITVFENADVATENELRSLDAQFVAARHGIDPRTGESVSTRRRSLVRAVALQVLVAGGGILRERLRHIDAELSDAALTLRAIVLNAYALRVLDPAAPPPSTADEREAAWRAISRHPELQPAARQLTVALNPSDLMILLDDLFTTLAQPDRELMGALT